ncbi:hypothetical protein ABT352_03480 [Streptosporangium sp. NPDC000563]|uniref:hypothetical protein n=1 Tax=unclassified Streptosporangium TaxID=2632669 RepID=UPI0033308DF9
MIVLAVALAACGSGGGGAPAAVPETPAPTQQAPSDGTAPSQDGTPAKNAAPEVATGIPPKPDAATQAKFIAALEAIDPDIVHGKEDKAVDRARNQCSSVKEFPDDQAKLVELTNQRFSSPDRPEGFGATKAAGILKAVRTHICPDF